MLERFIQSETTTNKLNNLAHQFILDHGGMPASLNYQGFPKSICTSLNEEFLIFHENAFQYRAL